MPTIPSPGRLLSLSLALLLGLAAGPASAQVKLGVSGGLNFASLNDVRDAATEVSLENSTGFHAGIYADVSALLVSFRTGVFYLSAGEVQRGSETLDATFITVPVELHLQTPTPAVRVYALIGPEARFPVGESITDVETRSVNVAGNVGLGVSFGVPFAGPTAFAEIRYAQDLTGFARDQGLETDNEYELSLFMVRAGIGL